MFAKKTQLLVIPLCAVEIFVLMIALERPARAYVDPGSGLLLFQIGGSILAGALFTVRGKLRRLFRLGSSANQVHLQKDQTATGETHACEPDPSR
jgi:hypothetical protein